MMEYRIALLGNNHALEGLTLAFQYPNGIPDDFQHTEKTYRIQREYEGERVQFDLLDSSGSDDTYADAYIRTSHAIVLVYANDCLDSLKQAQQYASQIKRHVDDMPAKPILLLANHATDTNALSKEADQLATTLKATHLTCSASQRSDTETVLATLYQQIQRLNQPEAKKPSRWRLPFFGRKTKASTRQAKEEVATEGHSSQHDEKAPHTDTPSTLQPH